MFLSWKHIVFFVFSGVVLGLVISPFTDKKPQDLIKSPVPEVYAVNPEPDPVLAQEWNVERGSVKRMFVLFDWEQRDRQTPRSTVFDWLEQTALPVSQDTRPLKIAIIGDSMVDTMGTNLPYLRAEIAQYAPHRPLTLWNYGIGAQNAKAAASRIGLPYEYKDRSYPVITQTNADIFVIESFAYNPLSVSELSDYEASLTFMIKELQATGAKVIFLATQAPLKTKFGVGSGGVNWPPDDAWTHATKIQKFMDTGIRVAQNQNVPVIDIYHQTLQPSGEGKIELVSSHDGIHPSDAGHKLGANLMVKKWRELKWL